MCLQETILKDIDVILSGDLTSITNSRKLRVEPLCSVYLPPRNHFNFISKDPQDLIDQLPSPFIFMGDFNGHHTLWGYVEINNRGSQLEEFSENYLILLNDKIHTYFHSASGTFTSIDITRCSPSLFLDFSWKVCPDPCSSDHFIFILKNDGTELEISEVKLG